jgi:hypothetical protein
VDGSVETSVDMLLVRVVELAITDTKNSVATKEHTGTSNELSLAFIMSTKFLQQEVPSTIFITNSPADFWVLNKKFQL